MTQAQAISMYQPLLQTIALKIVRCKQDAEDIVQETFLKWLSIDQQSIQNTKAYLVKAVTNNCINHLQSLKNKKEQYMENLSEIIHQFKETNLSYLDLEINLSAAFARIHHKLEPLERAVYLLKEVFDFDYDALQLALDKKKDHCRQLFCRAKKKLQEETSRISLPEKTKLFESFKSACRIDNTVDLVSDLKSDISQALSSKVKK